MRVPSQALLLREAMAWASEWARLSEEEKEPLRDLGFDKPELLARVFADDEFMESFALERPPSSGLTCQTGGLSSTIFGRRLRVSGALLLDVSPR